MQGRRNEKGLTPKQENFARNVAEGMSLSNAYRAAYDAENMSSEAVNVEASRLRDHPAVSLRVDELVEERVRELERKGISDRDEVTKLAKQFATDDGKPDAIRLRALELWGRTCGAFVEIIEDKRERPVAAVTTELERRLSALLDTPRTDSLPLVDKDDEAGSTATVQ